MSRREDWAGVSERGSLGALRLMAGIYRVFGRGVCQALLHPIVTYFMLRDSAARRASRSYLRRIAASRLESGRQSHDRLTPYGHQLEFAAQILDRMVVWGGGLSRFRMEHCGSEHLFRLAREGRGALLLGAHVGSFDMARQLAVQHGLVLNVVMFTAHAERINRVFEQLDPRSRVRVLQLDPGSIRTAFEIKACIDRGELVGILADRTPPGGREQPFRLDFLGAPAPFPRSPFRLAGVLGCPVFLSLCLRTGDARYETFVEPLSPGRRLSRGEREKGAEELARAYLQRLEAVCLRFPYQWFNFYDVWKAEAPS